MTSVEKVTYVKAQTQTRAHTCHWPDCEQQVPPAMWGCKQHWFSLPKNLRDQIWATYVPGQEIDMSPSAEYLDAATEVEAWINAQQALEKKRKTSKKLLDQFGNPISDSYCTPPWLTALLPLVDVDPCSNPRSTVRARRRYSLETKLDGLKLPWRGSAFINWPYSCPLIWIDKLIEEWVTETCTEAIVLCKLDSSTEWWNRLIGFGQPDLWLFDKRIPFDEPPELVEDRIRKFAAKGKKGGEKSANNFCSAIVHHRGPAVDGGREAAQLDLEAVASLWRPA